MFVFHFFNYYTVIRVAQAPLFSAPPVNVILIVIKSNWFNGIFPIEIILKLTEPSGITAVNDVGLLFTYNVAVYDVALDNFTQFQHNYNNEEAKKNTKKDVTLMIYNNKNKIKMNK